MQVKFNLIHLIRLTQGRYLTSWMRCEASCKGVYNTDGVQQLSSVVCKIEKSWDLSVVICGQFAEASCRSAEMKGFK